MMSTGRRRRSWSRTFSATSCFAPVQTSGTTFSWAWTCWHHAIIEYVLDDNDDVLVVEPNNSMGENILHCFVDHDGVQMVSTRSQHCIDLRGVRDGSMDNRRSTAVWTRSINGSLNCSLLYFVKWPHCEAGMAYV
jgi:hypothetical protein